MLKRTVQSYLGGEIIWQRHLGSIAAYDFVLPPPEMPDPDGRRCIRTVHDKFREQEIRRWLCQYKRRPSKAPEILWLGSVEGLLDKVWRSSTLVVIFEGCIIRPFEITTVIRNIDDVRMNIIAISL